MSVPSFQKSRIPNWNQILVACAPNTSRLIINQEIGMKFISIEASEMDGIGSMEKPQKLANGQTGYNGLSSGALFDYALQLNQDETIALLRLALDYYKNTEDSLDFVCLHDLSKYLFEPPWEVILSLRKKGILVDSEDAVIQYKSKSGKIYQEQHTVTYKLLGQAEKWADMLDSEPGCI
jgi:hypothetical protein